jgi:hypothetical protein
MRVSSGDFRQFRKAFVGSALPLAAPSLPRRCPAEYAPICGHKVSVQQRAMGRQGMRGSWLPEHPPGRAADRRRPGHAGLPVLQKMRAKLADRPGAVRSAARGRQPAWAQTTGSVARHVVATSIGTYTARLGGRATAPILHQPPTTRRIGRLIQSAVPLNLEGDPAASAAASGGPREWSSVAEALPGRRRSSSWK